METLRGRTAIVTGGAVRIGRALAERLAASGVNICVHCHSHRAEAQKVVAKLQSAGVRACVACADLSQAGAAAGVFDQACDQLGIVDILINSAAIFEPSMLADLTADHWRRHLAINLEATTFLCQEFARRIPAGRSGAIVNIADWRALRPAPGHLAYSIAKAAIVTLTKVLAQELGPQIRVNAIAPGAILPAPGKTIEEFQRLANANPLKRTGSPDDVADAALFLLSAPFINGEVLHVTGGEELT